MKKPSDELFQFIQALNSREKAFIKQCLKTENRKEKTNNDKLFTYLCKRTVYNEAKMQKALPFLPPKLLKHSKNTLYDFLLKKLELYHSEANDEQQLYKVLFRIQLLRKKKFFSKANQLLNFAIDKAERYDFFMVHVQLLKEQQQLALDGKDTERYEALFADNRKKQDDLYEYYVTEQNISKNIGIEINKINYRDSYVTGAEREAKLRAIRREILNVQQNTKNFPAIIKFNLEFLNCHVLAQLKEYKQAETSFKKLESACEAIDFGFIHPERYMSYLLVGVSIFNKNEDKKALYRLIKKIDIFFEMLPDKQKSMDVISRYYSVKNNIITYLGLSNEFDAAKIESEKILPVIVSKNMALEPTLKKVFLSNLCGIYLFCGEFKKALPIYNAVINNEKLMAVRVDCNYEMNITMLAVLYELGMYSNMESLMRQCKRDEAFEQQSFIYRALIDFFTLLQKAEGEIEYEKTSIKNILLLMNKIDPSDKASMFFIKDTNIGYWLKSKIRYE